ncbi:MAG: hypothetical protein ACI4RL_01010 [Ruminococcus sp.]
MSKINETPNNFVGYEYKEINVSREKASFYLDCYENFGWIPDENATYSNVHNQNVIRFKRDRKIINKMELTRLQRNFEACTNEISLLEKSKKSIATVWALTVAIIGTAFMAGSTFAVTASPPIIWLCVLLAIPGIIGWILPYFLYQHFVKKQTRKIQPLIEAKYDEIYKICEKGFSLL